MSSGPLLLCFDGSPAAERAIRYAGDLFAGRDAIVLSVAVPAREELPLDPGGDLVGRVSGLYRDWDEIATEIAERHARAGATIADDAGLKARSLTASGKPAATIMHVAETEHVGMIVLGAGGHGAIGGLIGSVSARVVQQSSRPVLVVPSR